MLPVLRRATVIIRACVTLLRALVFAACRSTQRIEGQQTSIAKLNWYGDNTRPDVSLYMNSPLSNPTSSSSCCFKTSTMKNAKNRFLPAWKKSLATPWTRRRCIYSCYGCWKVFWKVFFETSVKSPHVWLSIAIL